MRLVEGEEDLVIRCVGRSRVADVSQEAITHRSREGLGDALAALGGVEVNAAVSPVNVGQRQAPEMNAPHPVGVQELDDGVGPPPGGTGRIDGIDQALNRGVSDGLGHPREAALTHGRHRGSEIREEITPVMGKSQKRAQSQRHGPSGAGAMVFGVVQDESLDRAE